MKNKKPSFPFLNPHFNTIFGSNGPRKWLVRYRAKVLNEKSREMVLECSGGVWLHGVYTEGWDPERGMVILLHGWEGTANSTYLLSAAMALYREGYSIFRLHMRDHGPSHHLNVEPFLAVRLNEILDAIEAILKIHPQPFVGLAGFSLGANLAVRVAANLADRSFTIDRVLAVSPPIDPEVAGFAIQRYPVYNRYFVRKWQRSFRKKMALFAQYRANSSLLKHRDIMAMHEEFVPKFSAYPNASSYFAAYALTAANLKKMDSLCRILMVEDDPIIPVETLSDLPRLEGLELDVMPHGGHCGFVSDWSLDSWFDAYILSFMDNRS